MKFRKVITNSGKETIECSVGGIKASVPFGTSTVIHEVTSFSKFGIDNAIKNFPDLRDTEFSSLKEFEDEILKTDKSPFNRIGGNLVLASSICFLRLLAKQRGVELFELFGRGKIPSQLGKVVGGGKHTNKGPVFQEFLILSKGDIKLQFENNKAFHKRAGVILKSKNLDLEGGWIVGFDNMDVLNRVCDLRDDEFSDVKVGVDIAASSFYDKGYDYGDKVLSSGEHFDFIKGLIKDYKLFYVEDAFHEEDFISFHELKRRANCLVVGDDLLATNPERLMTALKEDSVNGAIVKPNQIGLLSEMFQFVKSCKRNKIKTIFSHRSNETADDFLADLSIGGDIIKVGIVGKERVSKINRLIRISEMLNAR